jgi:L-alanine-DL-glutamate epimerase-like enolase superfamily enzyme
MSAAFELLAHAPTAIITAIEITRHRHRFDPPFNASWDSKPRMFWDAAIVRVHTDLGVTGIGSGDMMLGFEGHEHLFVGQQRPQWKLMLLRMRQCRSTSRCGISPARSPASPAGS